MNKTPGVMPGVSVHASERDTPTRTRPETQRERFAVIVAPALWRGFDVVVEPPTPTHPLRHFRDHPSALNFAGQLAGLNRWRLFDRVRDDG
jgi:hypothetical protein